MPKEIELKCWPEYYNRVEDGSKPFDLRKDDRDYEVGDTLLLRRWLPDFKGGIYDGNQIRKRITYILRDAPQFGLQPGYVILGLGEVPNG